MAGTSRLQGESEIDIDADASTVWEILEDSASYLPRLWPMVKSVEIDGKERLGGVRKCDVNLAGRHGHTLERCIESIPHRKLSHSIEDDSFGFTETLSDFWFSFILEPQSSDKTRVRVETHFEPNGVKGRLMSALMIKRKFRGIRGTALGNLKGLAEKGGAASAPSIADGSSIA